MLPKPYYDEGGVTIYHSDCLELMRHMEENSIDAIVTDPPYALTGVSRNGSPRNNDPSTPYGRTKLGGPSGGFMGKAWDAALPSIDVWQEALRVIKPGGHLVCFGGTRTYHRLACAVEDAGWEIRDCLMWIYGSGFPKSLNVSKAIDKEVGVERAMIGHTKAGSSSLHRVTRVEQGYRESLTDVTPDALDITAPNSDAAKQWDGWGTALKPAYEPILLARKPLNGTVAQNVVKWGTGAVNIDACRVETDENLQGSTVRNDIRGGAFASGHKMNPGDIPDYEQNPLGRWPANVIHDGSDEVLDVFPEAPGQCADAKIDGTERKNQNVYGAMRYGRTGEPSADSVNAGLVGFNMRPGLRRLDAGSAARFFYTAKASSSERNGPLGIKNSHPTVKPLALMTYLLKLVVQPGGTALDPYMGSGSTLVAAKELGLRGIGIDREDEYITIAAKRLAQGTLPL